MTDNIQQIIEKLEDLKIKFAETETVEELSELVAWHLYALIEETPLLSGIFKEGVELGEIMKEEVPKVMREISEELKEKYEDFREKYPENYHGIDKLRTHIQKEWGFANVFEPNERQNNLHERLDELHRRIQKYIRDDFLVHSANDFYFFLICCSKYRNIEAYTFLSGGLKSEKKDDPKYIRETSMRVIQKLIQYLKEKRSKEIEDMKADAKPTGIEFVIREILKGEKDWGKIYWYYLYNRENGMIKGVAGLTPKQQQKKTEIEEKLTSLLKAGEKAIDDTTRAEVEKRRIYNLVKSSNFFGGNIRGLKNELRNQLKVGKLGHLSNPEQQKIKQSSKKWRYEK